MQSWLSNWIRKHHRLTANRALPRRDFGGVSPLIESLEDRTVPAVFGSDQIQQAYGLLPISFEANVGQTDSQVQYLARGNGYALFLTPDSAVLSLTKSGPVADAGAVPTSTSGVALGMRLVGAGANSQIVGSEPLPGTSNYFIGDDPSQWHTNVANYGKVVYQDVYPGVDLAYYGNQQQLEYDFVLAPGADPKNIRFAIEGADSLSLDDEGNLVLHTSEGDVLEDAPVLSQTVDGTQQPVAGRFVLLGQDQVGFQVDAYDSSLPLTIDPILSYSTFLSGTQGLSMGNAIAVDGSGNAVVTGYTSSTTFPVSVGAFRQTHASDSGSTDAFVTKLNATGTALIYSTYLGGNSGDQAYGVAIDASGAAYVTGYTRSSNFPTTAGAFRTTHDASDDYEGFVAKLNATGTSLSYSTFLGGFRDFSFAIAVDGQGSAYVAGYIQSNTFPTTAGAFQTTYVAGTGESDGFVAKLNASGTALVYGTYLGGAHNTQLLGIAVNSAGNAYVTGYTESANFPVTAGVLQTTFHGGRDATVTELNATGTGLVYSTYLGGSSLDYGLGIALDSTGNAYVAGGAMSTNFPTTAGAFKTTHASDGGTYDAFVAKLNPTGTALGYSTFVGGSAEDGGGGIAVSSAGEAYVVGYSYSTNFPTTANAFQPGHASITESAQDGVFFKLNATGSALVYSTYLGGKSGDSANGIALDSKRGVYIVGYTPSTDFPVTAGAFKTTGSANGSGFVAKFDFAPTITSLSPNATVFGGAGFTLTINGSEFDPAAVVVWNSTTLAVTSRTGGTQIQANVPASLIAAVAPVNIVVFNPGISSKAFAFTINRADTVTTIILGAEFVSGSVPYDGHGHGAVSSWTSTGVDGGHGSLQVSYVGINGTNYSSSTTAPTNAGSYRASASFVGDNNHNSSSYSIDFVIAAVGSKTTVTLSGEFVAASVTFDSHSHGATASWTTTGADGEGGPLTVFFVGINGTSYPSSPTAPTNAGSYRASATFGDNNHTSSSNSVDFAITKADAIVTVNGLIGVYDGSSHGASGSVTGVVADPSAVGSSLDLGPTFINPPGGTASWTFHGGSNYKDQSGTAVIKILGIGGVRQNEGNVGTTVFAFPIAIPTAPAANQSFTVQYATGGGTADGNDYQAMSGILTFGPGVTLQYIYVVVYGDLTPESNDTFVVNLSNPRLYTNGVWAAATLPNTQAVGTIVDDDHTNLAVSMTSIRQAEGNSGTTLFTFSPTLNAAPASGQYFTVDYTTATAGSGTGYADGNDFTSKAGTLTFLAGSTTPSAPLTIAVTGDTKNEGDETFNVVLSNPKLHPTGTAASIPGNISGPATVTATIANDDVPTASVSINNVTQAKKGFDTLMTFTVTRTGTIAAPITINWQTLTPSSIPAGYDPATGNDYQGSAGTMTFTPTGPTTATISILIRGTSKTLAKPLLFDVVLSMPPTQTLYTLGTSIGVGVITN